MKLQKIFILIYITILTLFISFPAGYTENYAPSNEVIEIKKRLEKSYSPRIKKKFDKIVLKAQKYADEHYVENGAIIFDIDETLLDNRGYYNLYSIYTPEDWDKWVRLEQAVPFASTVAFLKWAKQKGYTVVLITGRFESQQEATKDNLAAYGIPYDFLFMRPDNKEITEVSDYKREIRDKLTKTGYTIIINIGDQKSDMRGGPGKGFKLPNPIYTIP